MTAVLHLIDASCDQTSLQVLGTLCSRSSAEAERHVVCSIDGPMTDRAAGLWSCGTGVQPVASCGTGVPPVVFPHIHRAERRLLPAMNWAPQLGAVARRTGAAIVHAWGVEAAAVCSSRLPDLPLVMTLLYPDATRNAAKWLRSFPTDATVVAGSQVIRSRLLTAGVAPERVVVIRGPADLAAVNRARKENLRREVVGDAHPVLLLPGPPSRSGGQFYGLWAAAVLKQVHPNLRVIMPYDSPESRRLLRFAGSTRIPDLLTVPDPCLTWPQLVACADVFLLPASDEICIEPITTAMAAGLVIVATAVRSVAELIADNHNGLLCKPRQRRPLAGKILQAIEDQSLRVRLTDTARAQAYEIAGVRAFTDNYARLHQNVLAGRTPAEGVRDTAMVA